MAHRHHSYLLITFQIKIHRIQLVRSANFSISKSTHMSGQTPKGTPSKSSSSKNKSKGHTSSSNQASSSSRGHGQPGSSSSHTQPQQGQGGGSYVPVVVPPGMLPAQQIPISQQQTDYPLGVHDRLLEDTEIRDLGYDDFMRREFGWTNPGLPVGYVPADSSRISHTVPGSISQQQYGGPSYTSAGFLQPGYPGVGPVPPHYGVPAQYPSQPQSNIHPPQPSRQVAPTQRESSPLPPPHRIVPSQPRVQPNVPTQGPLPGGSGQLPRQRCPICPYQARIDRTGMQGHCARWHTKFLCTYCDAFYDTNQHLEGHAQARHPPAGQGPVAGPSTGTYEYIAPPSQPHPSAPAVVPDDLYCALCKHKFGAYPDWVRHFSTQKHRNAEAKAQGGSK